MKNTFFLICAGLMLTIGAQAQTKKKAKAAAPKVNVPESVDASFKSNFTVAENNKWSKNYTGNYVATFTNADSRTQVTEFNPAGVWVKSRTTFDIANPLPENITTAVQTKYSGSSISELEKVEIAGMKPYYRVKLTTADTKTKEIILNEEGSMVRL
ncbi:MAG: hypothetical protein EOO07_38540 [Chitinophagaceae bacterium]|nr:MAG: hypothetical protein EOO07_38540 [Chitinophagaceae bacterium]